MNNEAAQNLIEQMSTRRAAIQQMIDAGTDADKFVVWMSFLAIDYSGRVRRTVGVEKATRMSEELAKHCALRDSRYQVKSFPAALAGEIDCLNAAITAIEQYLQQQQQVGA